MLKVTYLGNSFKCLLTKYNLDGEWLYEEPFSWS